MQSANFTFRLRRWAAWTTESTNIGSEKPPSTLRRRVSPLGQQALQAAWNFPEAATARLVLSSRHGEYGRTLSILDTLAAGTEVSPADFTLSVHHALIGLLSIACGNRHGHVAVAAGSESFCFGLLEAAGCLAENPDIPVLLLHLDAPLPAPFDVYGTVRETPEALALVLSAEGEGQAITMAARPSGATAPSQRSHARTFLSFLGAPERAGEISVGERLTWQWRRDGAAA